MLCLLHQAGADFGDGQNSVAEIYPNHIYLNPGIHEVTLLTSDPTSCNLLDSISKTIEIREHQFQKLESLFICKGDAVQLVSIIHGRPQLI